MTVDLSEAEWNAVMGMLSMGPWREANPLLMKIGEQLRAQKTGNSSEREEVDMDIRGKLVGRGS